jgi:hypothetical protein
MSKRLAYPIPAVAVGSVCIVQRLKIFAQEESSEESSLTLGEYVPTVAIVLSFLTRKHFASRIGLPNPLLNKRDAPTV